MPEAEGPTPKDAGLSQRMSRYPRKDTSPEVELRKALHALGLRFRLQRKVPGRGRRSIDIAFPGSKVAVFVDGCFWHACPTHGIVPKNNRQWWQEKLQGNTERDQDTNRCLIDAGWSVVRVWEHTEVGLAASAIAEELVRDGQPTVLTV